MNDARSQIEKLLKEMETVLVLAGVPKHQIHMQSGGHKIDTCANAFDWLHDLKMSKEYSVLGYIWDLLPEEVWKRYEICGIEGMREQYLLADAKLALLKKWKKGRPRLFNRNSKKDSDDKQLFNRCKP